MSSFKYPTEIKPIVAALIRECNTAGKRTVIVPLRKFAVEIQLDHSCPDVHIIVPENHAVNVAILRVTFRGFANAMLKAVKGKRFVMVAYQGIIIPIVATDEAFYIKELLQKADADRQLSKLKAAHGCPFV